MKAVVADFETYWSEAYTLSKMTTEEYVRDPKFETILCGFRFDTGERIWIPGPKVGKFLQQLGLHQYAVIAHHAHFDGLILSHHYGVYPGMWLDTLSMSRAINGVKGGNGLAKCAERHGLGVKGQEVILNKGKRFADFDKYTLNKYGEYCLNDCDLEWDLFNILLPHFQFSELKLIDRVIRAFTEPVLELNVPMLEKYVKLLQTSKAQILADAGIDIKTVMSADKFAEALRFLGVDPPTKWSEKQKKEVYAFAKTDKVMQDLAENGPEEVQILIAARMQNKTTIAETRGLRMIGMQGRGPACVYYKYCGAEDTLRLSGGDKMNWQNMTRGSILRHAVEAPPGWVNVVGDSSNIEARIVDTLAGQLDMIQAYRDYDAGRGPDIYCVTGQLIYNRVITKKDDPEERQTSKVVKLSSGYGISGPKLAATFRAQTKKIMPNDTGNLLVKTYRRGHMEVVRFWSRCEQALFQILRKIYGQPVDRFGIITTCEDGLRLPNGLKLRYPDLQYHGKKDFNNPGQLSGFTYWDGKVRSNIHGAKLCIAGGTDVLTSTGWKPIEQVSQTDLVHDGVEFVVHGGMVYNSVQSCVTVDGVFMTPDHEVLTDEGWQTALQKPRPYRPNLWGVAGYAPDLQRRQENVLDIPLRVWASNSENRCLRNQRIKTWRVSKLWVLDKTVDIQRQHTARNESPPSIQHLAGDDQALHITFTRSMGQLWGEGHYRLQAMVGKVRNLLARYGSDVRRWINSRTQEQRPWVFEGELCVGYPQGTSSQSAWNDQASGCSSAIRTNRYRQDNDIQPHQSRLAVGQANDQARLYKPVFDITNCGPRQRYVVRGVEGPFIVHNCGHICQALARIVVMDQIISVKRKLVITSHDEGSWCVPEDEAEDTVQEVLSALRVTPAWFPALPVNAEVGYHRSYGKAKK